MSSLSQWGFLAKYERIEAELAQKFATTPLKKAIYEFTRFGVKSAWATLFGFLMLSAMLLTKWYYPENFSITRYDFLTLYALFIQIILILAKMETLEEVKVIAIYHVIGTLMEIYKVKMGSWVYPEAGVLKIFDVPLFSGFMYACIGSYIARSWRLFDFKFTNHPNIYVLFILSAAIYINFFTHHYFYDMRYFLMFFACLLFFRATVHFKVWQTHRTMPLLLGLLLVTIFIWFAENIGTFANAWIYPNQKSGWKIVSPAKFGSWFMLMLLSYALVAYINKPTSPQ